MIHMFMGIISSILKMWSSASGTAVDICAVQSYLKAGRAKFYCFTFFFWIMFHISDHTWTLCWRILEVSVISICFLCEKGENKCISLQFVFGTSWLTRWCMSAQESSMLPLRWHLQSLRREGLQRWSSKRLKLIGSNLLLHIMLWLVISLKNSWCPSWNLKMAEKYLSTLKMHFDSRRMLSLFNFRWD